MFSWLKSTLPGRKDTRPDTPPEVETPPARPTDNPGWEPPPTRHVAAIDQVAGIIDALQDEGRTGVVPRDLIHRRYGEYCMMWGYEPVGLNDLFEAFPLAGCRRVRRMVDGHKITAYVIPARGAEVATFPSGKKPRVLAPKGPKRVRSGTWPRPANDLRRHVSSPVRREPYRVAA